jgi:hypothetical protein
MKIKLLIIFLIAHSCLFSQKLPQNFYEHYTGLISDELKITADLVKTGNSFSGFYCYEYHEEGLWIASNPIALDGQVQADGSFVLNEFGQNSSHFKGILSNSKLITGTWVNSALNEEIDFTLKATYAQGTINLNVVKSSDIYYFENNKTQPTAHFNLELLFPSYSLNQPVYKQLVSKIYHYIGYRGEPQPQKSIVRELSEKFNQQFQNALENIKIDSFPIGFDWTKSIRMDVINNEGGIVCLQFHTYARSGDKSGSNVKKFLVFDVKANKVLQLNDLIAEEKKAELDVLIDEQIRKIYQIKDTEMLKQHGFFEDSVKTTQNFYIHTGGLGFYYNVYEIAPLSNGPTNLFITWADLKRKNIVLNIPTIASQK